MEDKWLWGFVVFALGALYMLGRVSDQLLRIIRLLEDQAGRDRMRNYRDPIP